MSDTTTFIGVHDQAIVNQLEEEGRFAHMSNVVYLFLGPRPVTDLAVPFVHCTAFQPDIPNLYDFAGFDVLVKNNLIHTKYSVFLQYDHVPIAMDAATTIERLLEDNVGMLAFLPAWYDPHNWMLDVPDFPALFHKALAAIGVLGDWSTLDLIWWPSTQGHAWRSSYFYNFINWARPAFNVIGTETFAGHIVERLLAVFCVLTHSAQRNGGLFSHGSADCHGTGALMRGNMEEFNARVREFGR